jgi:predicted phosphodiesterase
MSDLHLERVKYNFTITKAAPILLLAGDIGRFSDRDPYRNFLIAQCSQFDHVLLVAGNHEFYGCSRAVGLQTAQDFVADPAMNGRLVFLDRTRFDIPGAEVTLLGCTLHSHIAPDYTKLTNDFARIRDWKVADHNAEHRRDMAWLRASVEDVARAQRRIIIVTHYAPAFERTCHPRNEGNAVSQCFSSDALRQMREWPGADHVSHWVFGHTHWNSKFRAGGGLVVASNQLCNDESRLTWWQRRTLYRAFDERAVITP